MSHTMSHFMRYDTAVALATRDMCRIRVGHTVRLLRTVSRIGTV